MIVLKQFEVVGEVLQYAFALISCAGPSLAVRVFLSILSPIEIAVN